MNREQRRAAEAAARRAQRAARAKVGNGGGDKERLDAVARAAAAGDLPEQGRPTITIPAPEVGSVEGTMNIQRIRGRDRDWIRLVSHQPSGLWISDLPITNDAGDEVAAKVGATIYRLAKEDAPPITGPDGRPLDTIGVADGRVEEFAAEVLEGGDDVSRETSRAHPFVASARDPERCGYFVGGSECWQTAEFADHRDPEAIAEADRRDLEVVPPIDDDEGGRRGD